MRAPAWTHAGPASLTLISITKRFPTPKAAHGRQQVWFMDRGPPTQRPTRWARSTVGQVLCVLTWSCIQDTQQAEQLTLLQAGTLLQAVDRTRPAQDT